jgi:prophage tail gpP-like protein
MNMAIKTKMSIQVDSSRTGRSYDVRRFTEFNVCSDLETDSDSFDVVIKNPDGMYTGLFSKFDKCAIRVNSKKIMTGNLDKIGYIWTGDDDYIQLTGRDLCWKLVDNDALPDTIENVVPKTYITKKCKEYGIKSLCEDGADVYDKLVIGCGESEISIMNNILLESKHRIWYLVDTLYSGVWSTNVNSSHTFVRGVDTPGIPIVKLTLDEVGTDMKSEVRIYGSNDDGTQKMIGKSTNAYMIDKGINKRQVRRSYSDKASSKYTSVALRDIRDNFRNNIVLTLVVRFDSDNVYMPNTTALIHDAVTGINSVLFIKKVQYSKILNMGSTVTLTMIPADTSFEKLWKSTTSNSITNLNKLSKEMR